jgi:hypothetical protein
MLSIASVTGVRVSEIAGLRMKDVTALPGPAYSLKIIGKGNKQRPVPLMLKGNAALTAGLAEHTRYSSRPRVLPTFATRGSLGSVPNRWLEVAFVEDRCPQHLKLSPIDTGCEYAGGLVDWTTDHGIPGLGAPTPAPASVRRSGHSVISLKVESCDCEQPSFGCRLLAANDN